MKVLVACEESQRVCVAFRERGHEAYSCDIQECSGGHPEWHIKGDVLALLDGDCCFITQNNFFHRIFGQWDLIIAHPPCTYLSHAATRCHSLKCKSVEQINERTMQRIDSMLFFMRFANAKCDKIAIENPVGVMNTCYRSPDQIIQPYYFAESVEDTENYVTKETCLWLKGLPALKIGGLPKPNNEEMFGRRESGKVNCWCERVKGKDRQKLRSKTFTGAAKAFAEQWGGIA